MTPSDSPGPKIGSMYLVSGPSCGPFCSKFCCHGSMGQSGVTINDTV